MGDQRSPGLFQMHNLNFQTNVEEGQIGHCYAVSIKNKTPRYVFQFIYCTLQLFYAKQHVLFSAQYCDKRTEEFNEKQSQDFCLTASTIETCQLYAVCKLVLLLYLILNLVVVATYSEALTAQDIRHVSDCQPSHLEL